MYVCMYELVPNKTTIADVSLADAMFPSSMKQALLLYLT